MGQFFKMLPLISESVRFQDWVVPLATGDLHVKSAAVQLSLRFGVAVLLKVQSRGGWINGRFRNTLPDCPCVGASDAFLGIHLSKEIQRGVELL